MAGAEPVTLAALPFRGKLLLRGGADRARAGAPACSAASCPGTLRGAAGGDDRALWLGPDEWLLLIGA